MNKWKLIYNFSHPKIARAALIVLLGMFSSSITILLSLSIGNYYEILSRHHSNKSMVLSQLHIKLPHDPNTFFIVFALVVMFKMALQFGEKYFSESLALSFTSGLQRKLFRHHVRMNMTDFSKKPVGKYLLRYSGDMTSIRQYISKGIFRFTADCIFILLTLVLLFNIDATITLVIIIALLLSFLFLNFINKKLRQIQSVRRDTLSSNLHFVNEGLKAISTIKIFNREYSTIKKYKGKEIEEEIKDLKV